MTFSAADEPGAAHWVRRSSVWYFDRRHEAAGPFIWRDALAALGLPDPVSPATESSVIAAYGAMSAPALALDEKAVSIGKVRKWDEVAAIIQKTCALSSKNGCKGLRITVSAAVFPL